MTAFNPGQSPPPVRMPSLVGTSLSLRVRGGGETGDTREAQNLVGETPCGFESHPPHLKIPVLGATGGVGSHIVEEARRRGHDVTAATRDLVDATDAASIARAAAKQDLVISAVVNRSDPAMIVDVARALLAGLDQAGTPRLIVVGGAGTLEVEPGMRVVDLPDFNPDYKAEALAHADVLELLRNTSTPVTWTVVTPPRSFDDSGRTGSYREAADELLLDEDGRSRISLEDFAGAILDEAESPRHPNARFTVAY
jgi:uncharacterized protein